MTLDTSVMNVAIATVAKDVGTTVTGIQFAITLYTLVMAAFMITGGKIGQIIGRKRAFMIGCVVYGCGSATTALAKSLPVLIVGWSVLEGLGRRADHAGGGGTGGDELRPRRAAAGPTGSSPRQAPSPWRWVRWSAGCSRPTPAGAGSSWARSILVLGILLLTRRMADSPAVPGVRLDPVGTLLSAAGLGLIVYGVIRSGTWGFVQPKPDAPQWLGMSPVVWLLLGGGAVLALFALWENRRLRRHEAALLDPHMLKMPRLQGGLTAFFFQFMLQAGLFFVIPLFLSVALGLSAVATGVRLLPLSVTLLLSAVGVPKLFPHGSPRRIVRVGFGLLFLGIVVLLAALDSGAGADIVTGPLLLAGLGIGTLASQLGAVTVSAVPDSQSGEVGGVQNTVTNLGASIGTALSGAILIAVLTTTFLGSVASNPAIPKELASRRRSSCRPAYPSSATPTSTPALEEADVPPAAADAIVDENAQSRINGLRAALAVLALIALIALALTRRLPTVQPGDDRHDDGELEPEPA